MEILDQELIEKHELSEDAQKDISAKYENIIADQKKIFEDQASQTANKNAEGILEGAAKAVEEKTNIKRDQGEKIADYIMRSSGSFLEGEKKNLENKEKEYEKMLKDGANDDDLKKKLDEYETELDKYKQSVAELEPLKEVKDKYDELSTEHDGLKKEIAFNKVKPNFPETVNKYEVDFKWNEFKKDVLIKYNLEIVDGIPVAIDKENNHKQVKLEDLITGNEELSELAKGRQQQGSGAKHEDEMTDIEGLPFKVPKNVDSKERSKLIREYLADQGVMPTDKEYSNKFTEYNKIILTANK